MLGILKITDKTVDLVSLQGIKLRRYYSGQRGGGVIRADWWDQEKEAVIVYLQNNKALIINRNCQVIRVI